MSSIKNKRILDVLNGVPVDKTPVWIMRQAGRYLPEYKATRAQAGSFLDLCQSPELASEVTIQPIKRFDLDAAIIFSDILTIPDAMGLELKFEDNRGPYFDNPIDLSLIHISEPTRRTPISYAVFCLKKIMKIWV